MIDTLAGISSPIIESAIVTVLGVAAIAFRYWRSGLALIIAASAWTWLCASPALALLLWHGLANPYPPKPPADYPPVDAIVLVGGGPVPRPLARWNAAIDPARATPLGMSLALYRHGKARRIAISAGPHQTGRLVGALIRQSIAPGALVFTTKSHSTHEDALYLAPKLRQADVHRILLVTTGLHMPRTVASFRAQHFAVIPAPAFQRDWIKHLPPHSWWPHHGALYLSSNCLHEYIGLFYYRLRGWIAW